MVLEFELIGFCLFMKGSIEEQMIHLDVLDLAVIAPPLPWLVSFLSDDQNQPTFVT